MLGGGPTSVLDIPLDWFKLQKHLYLVMSTFQLLRLGLVMYLSDTTVM
jgi:hypothetical protein